MKGAVWAHTEKWSVQFEVLEKEKKHPASSYPFRK